MSLFYYQCLFTGNTASKDAPRSTGVDMLDAPSEFLKSLQQTNGKVEITESLYSYFLEVLPPRSMGSNYFIFQEGEGEKLYFSEYNNHYYCYLLSDELFTKDWKIHVGISRNKLNEPFRVLFIYTDEQNLQTPDELQQFVGKEFMSVSDISRECKLSFRV